MIKNGNQRKLVVASSSLHLYIYFTFWKFSKILSNCYGFLLHTLERDQTARQSTNSCVLIDSEKADYQWCYSRYAFNDILREKLHFTQSSARIYWKEKLKCSDLQPFTIYLRLTLVSMWNSALREKFNFCFSTVFC